MNILPKLMKKHLAVASLAIAAPFSAYATVADYSSQQNSAFTSAIRYNTAGQVTAEIQADPTASTAPSGQYPTVRYIYDGQNRGLLIRKEFGYLNYWVDDTVAPADWLAGAFTISHMKLFEYDSYGRKIAEGTADATGTLQTQTHYSYDVYGRVECQAVRLNDYNFSNTNACDAGLPGVYGYDRVTKYEYNNLDNVTTEYRAFGTPLQQKHKEYTYVGNRVDTITDANKNTAKYFYDDYDRISEWCFPSEVASVQMYDCSDKESYFYDANGNRTELHKRDGVNTIGFVYDNLNRMIAKDLSDTSSQDVIYDYDLRDLQLEAAFGNGATGSKGSTTVVTGYNGFGELIVETATGNGGTFTTSHGYDSDGHRISTTYPGDNKTFYYTHDDLGKLKTLEDPQQAALVTVEYDDFERPYTATTEGDTVTQYGYDSVARLNLQSMIPAEPGYGLALDLAYNPAGQMVSRNLSNDLYHHVDGYGKTGNYAVNGKNQYTSVNGQTIGHDDNGNLTDDGDNTYTYDIENRLIAVSGGALASLDYDPMGRLMKYTAGGVAHRFVYSGDTAIAELAGTSGSTYDARYIHVSNMGTPLVAYEGGATDAASVRYLHTDHQGSVIAASTQTGSVDSVNTYDAYGVPSSLNEGRFGYTGQMWLPELGLYHYRARVYDPELGRFLQTDPVGYEDQMNLYAYVHNDPINLVDSTGQYAELAIEAVSMGMGLVSLGNNISQGNWGAALVDLGGVIVDGVGMAIPVVPGVASMGIQASRVGETVLSNSDNVVRGGTNTAERFTNGSGVTTSADGTLNGVSVNSAPGASVEQLSQGIPNGQVGTTTVGEIRAAGGDVVPSPTANNPNHCTMCGISAQKAEELFTPTIKNPSK